MKKRQVALASTVAVTMVVLFASAFALGCGSAQVTSIRSYDVSSVQHPRTIVVYDFAVRSDEVALDTGSKVESYLAGERATAEQLEEIRKVSSALSEVLIEEFQDAGLPAVRQTGAVEVPPGSLAVSA